MYDLRNLREMLCKELDEIADKREMSAGDLDAIQKLTSSIKNTYKSKCSRTAAIPEMVSGKRICAARMGAAALTVASVAILWGDTVGPMLGSICARRWKT